MCARQHTGWRRALFATRRRRMIGACRLRQTEGNDLPLCQGNCDVRSGAPRHRADIRRRHAVMPAEGAVEVGQIAEPDFECDRTDGAAAVARVVQQMMRTRQALAEHEFRECRTTLSIIRPREGSASGRARRNPRSRTETRSYPATASSSADPHGGGRSPVICGPICGSITPLEYTGPCLRVGTFAADTRCAPDHPDTLVGPEFATETEIVLARCCPASSSMPSRGL